MHVGLSTTAASASASAPASAWLRSGCRPSCPPASAPPPTRRVPVVAPVEPNRAHAYPTFSLIGEHAHAPHVALPTDDGCGNGKWKLSRIHYYDYVTQHEAPDVEVRMLEKTGMKVRMRGRRF